MTLPILLEPVTGGFRATTGGPFDAVAEAASAEQAVADVRAAVARRLHGGAVLLPQGLPVPSPVPVPPLAENPLFDDWLREVDAFRARREAEELAAGE